MGRGGQAVWNLFQHLIFEARMKEKNFRLSVTHYFPSSTAPSPGLTPSFSLKCSDLFLFPLLISSAAGAPARPRSCSTAHPASFTLLKAPVVVGAPQLWWSSSKKKGRVLKSLRTWSGVWWERVVGKPRRPISPRGQFNSSQLDSLLLLLSAAVKGGGGEGGRGEQRQLDHHHYLAVRAEQDALLTCCSNQTGADIWGLRGPDRHCLKMERSFHPHRVLDAAIHMPGH